MKTTFKGRKVELELNIDGNDAYAECGNYTDGAMEDLTDAELYEIDSQTDYSEAILNYHITRAEAYYEGER